MSASTTDYYNVNAEQFIGDTLSADMQVLYQPFLALLPTHAHILDAGCGSGRDSLAFLQIGYQVSAFDASEKMAAHAAELLGVAVPVRGFDDVVEVEHYDGIWACASLLHVSTERLADTFARLWRALKPGGALYCSFKHGSGERTSGGRDFTDANEQRIQQWTCSLPGVAKTDIWITADQRPGRSEEWLNMLMRKDGRELD